MRGFALFGVLYVNMHDFGAEMASGPIHDIATEFMLLFFESKFFGLFSILFGMGFALQLVRAEKRNTSFFRFYWRRLAVLFLLGWLHCAIYEGDILRLYAVLAVFLFPFRRWPARKLVWLSITIFVLDVSVYWIFESGIVEWGVTDTVSAEGVAGAPSVTIENEREARIAAHGSGSFFDVVAFNLTSGKTLRLLRGYGPSVLAFFLLGMAVIRAGLIHERRRHAARIRRIMKWSFLIGLPSTLAAELLAAFIDDQSSAFEQTLQLIASNVGYPVMMMFYASGIAILLDTARWHRLLHPLAAVGRTALTVYIAQSVFYTTLYYGYAFGQYGRVGAAYILPISVVVFALEVAACNAWMNRFRFGPLEWVWRSLTYWKVQPFTIPRSVTRPD